MRHVGQVFNLSILVGRFSTCPTWQKTKKNFTSCLFSARGPWYTEFVHWLDTPQGAVAPDPPTRSHLIIRLSGMCSPFAVESKHPNPLGSGLFGAYLLNYYYSF